MKKLFISLLCVLGFLLVSSCNYTCYDFNWDFRYAYIEIGNEVIEVEVAEWTEDSTTFTIIDKDGIKYTTDQKNVVLTSSKLNFENKKGEDE